MDIHKVPRITSPSYSSTPPPIQATPFTGKFVDVDYVNNTGKDIYLTVTGTRQDPNNIYVPHWCYVTFTKDPSSGKYLPSYTDMTDSSTSGAYSLCVPKGASITLSLPNGFDRGRMYTCVNKPLDFQGTEGPIETQSGLPTHDKTEFNTSSSDPNADPTLVINPTAKDFYGISMKIATTGTENNPENVPVNMVSGLTTSAAQVCQGYIDFLKKNNVPLDSPWYKLATVDGDGASKLLAPQTALGNPTSGSPAVIDSLFNYDSWKTALKNYYSTGHSLYVTISDAQASQNGTYQGTLTGDTWTFTRTAPPTPPSSFTIDLPSTQEAWFAGANDTFGSPDRGTAQGRTIDRLQNLFDMNLWPRDNSATPVDYSWLPAQAAKYYTKNMNPGVPNDLQMIDYYSAYLHSVCAQDDTKAGNTKNWDFNGGIYTANDDDCGLGSQSGVQVLMPGTINNRHVTITAEPL